MSIDREEVIRRFKEVDAAADAAYVYRDLESLYQWSMRYLVSNWELLRPHDFYVETLRGSIAKERMDQGAVRYNLDIADNDNAQRAGELTSYDPDRYQLRVPRGERIPRPGEIVLIKHSSIGVTQNKQRVMLLEGVVSPVPADTEQPEGID